MLLEGDGHQVSYCETGDEAPQAIWKTQPQVVLCDIGLPGRSGYEVAKVVRSREEGMALVMIALSGYGRSEDKQKARQAGFDGHLTKPVELDAIYSIVRPLFGRVTPASDG
jgi:two-component system CheB/CheR fusion protein